MLNFYAFKTQKITLTYQFSEDKQDLLDKINI